MRLGLRVGPARRHRAGGRADRRRDRPRGRRTRSGGLVPRRPGTAAGGRRAARRPARRRRHLGRAQPRLGHRAAHGHRLHRRHLHPDRDGPALVRRPAGGRRPGPPGRRRLRDGRGAVAGGGRTGVATVGAQLPAGAPLPAARAPAAAAVGRRHAPVRGVGARPGRCDRHRRRGARLLELVAQPGGPRRVDQLSTWAHVVALDLRGHGRSAGRSTFGVAEPADVAAAVAAGRALAPGLPVVALGISLGGASALFAAGGGSPLAGVIAVSAPAWRDLTSPAGVRLARWTAHAARPRPHPRPLRHQGRSGGRRAG